MKIKIKFFIFVNDHQNFYFSRTLFDFQKISYKNQPHGNLLNLLFLSKTKTKPHTQLPLRLSI